MPAKTSSLRISNTHQQATLELRNLDYLGSGAYTCRLLVNTNGFMCDKDFGFDNDEYFLAKLKDVLASHSGEADLTDLQADNYIRFQPFDETHLLITGLVVEEQPLYQSLEFAFTAETKAVNKFLNTFEKIVRANT